MVSVDRAISTTEESVEGEVVRLYEQHANALLRYAQARADSVETAREALQEVFLRYFVERTYGRQITDAKAWLFEVLRNYLVDRGKALYVQKEVAGEPVDRVADVSPDPETLAESKQMARELWACLSARELQCLRLRTEGLSYAEIGAAMHLQTGTVGALLARAHEKIRRHIAGSGGKRRALTAAIFCLMHEVAACHG